MLLKYGIGEDFWKALGLQGHPTSPFWRKLVLIFIGGTDVVAESPILWPPNEMSWIIWKDPDAGNDWRQEEKATTEDEMVGWHHWLNGHELSKLWELVMDWEAWHGYSPWGSKSQRQLSDWTELLGFSRREYWSGLSLLSPVGHILSELSTMTCLSWLALQDMVHSFFKLDNAVFHVISLISFLWLLFLSVCPLR